MSIRALIWDIGGVIVRTEDREPRGALGREFGMDYAEIDKFVFGRESAKLASLGQISEVEHWQNVCTELQIPESGIAMLQERFWAGDRVDFELIDTIRRLKSNYMTAVLSNAWSGMRTMIEEQWRIADAFDRLFISAEVGLAKPDPRIYQHVIRELEVLPQEAVFIDDFIENIQAASEAGLHTIHFQNPRQARMNLEAVLNQYGQPAEKDA